MLNSPDPTLRMTQPNVFNIQPHNVSRISEEDEDHQPMLMVVDPVIRSCLAVVAPRVVLQKRVHSAVWHRVKQWALRAGQSAQAASELAGKQSAEAIAKFNKLLNS